MVGLKRSRLPRFIDSSKDVRQYKNVKRNSGRDFMTVELDYFMKRSVCRDVRIIEDSRKEWEHSDHGDIDTEYLKYLTSDLMSARKSEDKKAISIDGTDKDPHYEMVLSCLKPYGTSCILEVSETNGLSVPIIYGLDESDELLKSKNVVNRVLRSHNKHLISSKDCSVNSDESDSLFRVGLLNDAVEVHGRYPLRSSNKVTDTKRVFSRDDDYANFFSSELIGQDGPDRALVRETNERKRFSAKSSEEGKRYALRSEGKVNETRKVEASVPLRKIDKPADLCSGLRVEESKVVSRDQPDLKGIHEAKKIPYKSDDDDTFYVNENGVCFMKSELSNDVIVVEDDDDSTVNSHGEISSDFRKDLIEKLRQPYNDKELKILYDHIRTRKPIDRHIDLRHGRAASFSGEKEGKSYLDQHFVLRRKLEVAEDNYEKLNLLRGFFFWLQNLTRDNAFEPWNDTACLAVLPQAVRKRKQDV